MMTAASKIGLSVAGLAVIAAGVVLWVKFGTLVYFDTIAAAFVGCLL
jgi:hypothetical protein